MNITSIQNRLLTELENTVLSIGGNPITSYGLPQPNRSLLNVEYERELSYNRDSEINSANDNIRLMNQDQLSVFNEFTDIIERYEMGLTNDTNLIFLDAPGGTGKTYVINTILSCVRGQGKIAIATATSGVASTLLTGGRTVHSTFKVPIDTHLTDFPTCKIKKQSNTAFLIRQTSVVIVDEELVGAVVVISVVVLNSVVVELSAVVVVSIMIVEASVVVAASVEVVLGVVESVRTCIVVMVEAAVLVVVKVVVLVVGA